MYDPHSKTFQVMNSLNVTFLLRPTSPCSSHLVLIVLSAPRNVQKRNQMREQIKKNIRTRVIFLVGLVSREEDKKHLNEEHQTNDDIVQSSVPDSYDTLSYKTISGFIWVNAFCGKNTRYIAKTDDDVEMDVDSILEALDNKYKSDPVEDILECPSVVRNMRPLQQRHSGTIMAKFFISRQELNRRVYPDLCFGWLYVTTPKVGLALAETAAKDWEEVKSRSDRDDYFITGFLREKLPWIRLGQLEGGFVGAVWDNFLSECTFLGISKNIFFNKFILSKGSGGVQYVHGWRLYTCIVWEFYVMGAIEILAPSSLVSWVTSLDICQR